MAPGFHIIYSASGKEGSLDKFLDRYNHKHVPVRLHHLKSFLSGVRHSVSNSQTPSWSISTISTTFLPSHMNPKPVYVQTVLLEKPH
ncbi:hypothetical protein D9758_017889 [Tetrapyrgos nigripes]|uniref:Uncharacterized protein n=1 Tax=Tetrapyrgos nigripes TaxID=182062 RepID=A0A8H5FDK5_9AGAR|nr:hypothetical protein D9758_017889 [Tetrapyrgos nigripes]